MANRKKKTKSKMTHVILYQKVVTQHPSLEDSQYFKMASELAMYLEDEREEVAFAMGVDCNFQSPKNIGQTVLNVLKSLQEAGRDVSTITFLGSGNKDKSPFGEDTESIQQDENLLVEQLKKFENLSQINLMWESSANGINCFAKTLYRQIYDTHPLLRVFGYWGITADRMISTNPKVSYLYKGYCICCAKENYPLMRSEGDSSAVSLFQAPEKKNWNYWVEAICKNKIWFKLPYLYETEIKELEKVSFAPEVFDQMK